MTTLLYLSIPYWLTYWAEQDDRNDNIGHYIGVLGWLVLVLFILGLIRNNLLAQTLQSSSKLLHNHAVMSIARFPSSYFDSNSTGAIMGKMSNDIMKMDEMIPRMSTDFLQVLFITAGSILSMVVGNPFMSIVLVPFAI